MKTNGLLISFMLSFVLIAHAQMRIHLINVGQGAATLVEFPCGAILVDAGGETNSDYKSNEALKTYLDDFFNVRTDLNHTLQCVYLTHPHKDHTLGVPVLLQAPYVIQNVVTDGLERGSGKAGQIALHQLAQNSDGTANPIGLQAVSTSLLPGTTGLTNNIIDPVNCTGTNPVITVLWGASVTNPGWSDTNFDNENNHSLVIRIDYGGSSMLITGDLEEAAQHSLVEKYNGTSMLDADVYLVGHHGSKNGSSQELLDKITPETALIGCGDPDRMLSWTAWAYGHPNKNVLDRLQNKLTATRTPISIKAGTGAKTFTSYNVNKAIYCTGWDGDVVLEGDSVGNWHNVQDNLVPALVNINTADVATLETLPGIGPTKAVAIVTHRTTHGNFASLDALDAVDGIGPATINLIRPYAGI